MRTRAGVLLDWVVHPMATTTSTSTREPFPAGPRPRPGHDGRGEEPEAKLVGRGGDAITARPPARDPVPTAWNCRDPIVF